MSMKLDTVHEYEKVLIAEINKTKASIDKIREALAKLPTECRSQLGHGELMNEGVLAGLTMALHLYREGKPQ